MDHQPISTLPDTDLQEGHQEATTSINENNKRTDSITDLQKFYDYDFHSDREFLNGWQKIPDQGNPENYLKAKVFYYSRKFGKALSIDNYKHWLEDKGYTDKGPPKDVQRDHSSDESLVNKNSHSETGEQSKEDNSAVPVGESISFGDVIDHIEQGLPLPGIKDLNIKPINTNPRASEMERKKKPWESDG